MLEDLPPSRTFTGLDPKHTPEGFVQDFLAGDDSNLVQEMGEEIKVIVAHPNPLGMIPAVIAVCK